MTEVLRTTDPRVPALLAAGWRPAGESWGARLRLGEPPDLTPFLAAVQRAEAAGYAVHELGRDRGSDLLALDAATAADYPRTPATAHEPLSRPAVEALWSAGGRVFGAERAGLLVAATVARAGGGCIETDFTAVFRGYRRQGLGIAVKAACVLTFAAAGARVFATGGAQANPASIRMNEALGWVIEERWLSLDPPARGS